MRTRHLFIFPLLAIAASAAAQESTSDEAAQATTKSTAQPRHQDASIFTQSGGPASFNDVSASVHGLMFRRAFAHTSQTFWKLGLGTGTTDFTNARDAAPPTADTQRSVLYHSRERVVQASGAVETERHLWRGLYLTGAFELQAGWRGGSVDSAAETSYGAPGQLQVFTSAAARYSDRRYTYGAGLGVLGIRGYTRRFTAAVEVFTGFSAGVASQTIHRPDLTEQQRRYSIFDISAGRFGSRVSVGYRF